MISPEARVAHLSRIRLRPKAGFGGQERGEVHRMRGAALLLDSAALMLAAKKNILIFRNYP